MTSRGMRTTGRALLGALAVVLLLAVARPVAAAADHVVTPAATSWAHSAGSAPEAARVERPAVAFAAQQRDLLAGGSPAVPVALALGVVSLLLLGVAGWASSRSAPRGRGNPLRGRAPPVVA